jgi:hypothetical protein
MHLNQTIEEIITSELRNLCSSCSLADSCVYHHASTKAIIQCELFELDPDERIDHVRDLPAGLCANCDHASYCKLPGRKDGVWRCNEFR